MVLGAFSFLCQLDAFMTTVKLVSFNLHKTVILLSKK